MEESKKITNIRVKNNAWRDDSNSRVHRLKPLEPRRYYSAFIYKRLDSTFAGSDVYDVEIYIDDKPRRYVNTSTRKCVHSISVMKAAEIHINHITYYMQWKFRHCQKTGDARITPIRFRGVFTHLTNNLDWIRSIVDVEFDYHIGVKKCVRRENAAYMKEYRRSQFTGYGPEFCDLANQQNNLSNSMLARIFPERPWYYAQ